MDISSLNPDQVASLVARILVDKDPASVGLRRIVRKKTVEACDFPMRAYTVEDFSGAGSGRKLLSDEERRIIELEQQVIELRKTLEQQTLQARTAVQAAHAKGLEEGRKKGDAEGAARAGSEYARKIESLQATMAAFMKNLENEKNMLYARADKTLLDLCRLMVKKIIGIETTCNGEVILNVLRKALTYVAAKEKLVIRVSPRDAATVQEHREFWAPVTEQLRDIVVEPDDRVSPGGCILESPSGMVDGRIETQLAELDEVIQKAWESMYAEKNTPEAAV